MVAVRMEIAEKTLRGTSKADSIGLVTNRKESLKEE